MDERDGDLDPDSVAEIGGAADDGYEDEDLDAGEGHVNGTVVVLAIREQTGIHED